MFLFENFFFITLGGVGSMWNAVVISLRIGIPPSYQSHCDAPLSVTIEVSCAGVFPQVVVLVAEQINLSHYLK